jgi:transcriptional regulator with XRE-family HTH domain
MDKEKMGKFLTQLRNEKNMRQQDEADIFQISPQAISKWESGDSVPDIAILEKLASFYNVGIDEIINGERKQKPCETPLDGSNKGFSKFYGIFIYGMSALALALLLAIFPYCTAQVTTTALGPAGYVTSTADVWVDLYQIIFGSTGSLTLLLWLIVVFLFASSLLTIGTWRDKKHRNVYWWLSFSFNLASLVLAFVVWSFFLGMPGPNVFLVFHIVYFVLYLTIPCCRHKSYCPKKNKVVD